MADESQGKDDRKDEPKKDSEASAGVGRFLYRLALAGVGGVVLAQEELSGLFQKRASDGATDDVAGEEGARESSEPAGERREGSSAMEATIDGVLHTLNLPTRGDVEDLTQKIDELVARVEALGDR